MSVGQQSVLNSIKSINRSHNVHVSLEQQCATACLQLLKRYPDRKADAGAALFLTMELTCYMADEALMTCSTRSVWLAKMSQADTHFHTSAPETSSCTRTEANWKLITERLKRGGDTFCICPSFDAGRVVVIFRRCAKTHERIMKVSVCGRHPAHPVKLRANRS